jgi:hypothetical protein
MIRKTIYFIIVCCLGFSTSIFSQNCSITIDNMTNIDNDTTLSADSIHIATFRMEVFCPTTGPFNISNGFIIYSPDGANWSYTNIGTLPAWSNIFYSYAFANLYEKINNTGTFNQVTPPSVGNDTVGFLYAGISFGAAMPDNFNDNVWTIEFNSNSADAGKHICIDSSFIPPGGSWIWASSGTGVNITPAWAGPYCYVISGEGSGCCDLRGDVTDDGSVLVDDLTLLVDYLFKGGAAPTCIDKGDATGDGSVLVDDLTLLVDYLFKGGTSPVPC